MCTFGEGAEFVGGPLDGQRAHLCVSAFSGGEYVTIEQIPGGARQLHTYLLVDDRLEYVDEAERLPACRRARTSR